MRIQVYWATDHWEYDIDDGRQGHRIPDSEKTAEWAIEWLRQQFPGTTINLKIPKL